AEEGTAPRELALDLPDREAGDRRVRRLALDPDEARRPAQASQPDPATETAAAESRPLERDRSAMRARDPAVRTESDAAEDQANRSREAAADDLPAEPADGDEAGGTQAPELAAA